jgi:DNA invertase Pin-like site-specific DNA recombinase
MEAGVDFVAVDAPFSDPLILHILSAVAEHERKMIAERTRAAMQAAKARGVIFGANGRKLADQHIAAAGNFAETMRQPISACIAQGAGTLQEVADGLNRAGYQSREGNPWSPGTVSRLLRRLDLRTGGAPS